eukprot:gene21081-27317_t
MANLVFVHGVATRDTPEYKASVANRDTLFRELLFTEKDVTIYSPTWGKLVPDIPSRVFDTDQGVRTYSLRIGVPGPADGSSTGAAGDISIGAVGKQDPTAALDAILSEVADKAARYGRQLLPEELNAFREATDLIETDSAEAVFGGDASPKSISGHFNTGQPAAFGVGSFIADAVTKVTDRVRNAASTLGFGAVRDGLSSTVGLFLGDVFVYLKEGKHREDIRNEVRKSLIAAHEASKAGGGPLIVVGHSMGGVILVDMLADPAAAGLPANIHIDALLTVGSQPGFFAALDLLVKAPPGANYNKPACAAQWLNVFDPIDPLAFRCDATFSDVTDLAFNSVTGVTEAHSKYFQRPQFYARTRSAMTLLLDRTVHGKKTHAFVIGVGSYPYAKPDKGVTEVLDVPDLPSAADSAKLFTDWLLESQDKLAAPLATLDVLISDPQLPANRYPWAQGPVAEATEINIKVSGSQWFQRLVRGQGDVALFYCCGHGASRLEKPVLFGADLNSDITNPWCHVNLGFLADALGKLQNISAAFLFSDACGQFVPDFELMRPPPQDCRFFPGSPFGLTGSHVALLCAAAEGRFAYEGTEASTSLVNYGRFTQTLLKGLKGSSARLSRNRFGVCSGDLMKDLKSIRRVFFSHWDPRLPFEPHQPYSQTDPIPIVYPQEFELPIVISTDPEDRMPHCSLLLSQSKDLSQPWLKNRGTGFMNAWQTSVSPGSDILYAIAGTRLRTMGAGAMKTSLHFEAPKDLSVGTVKISGASGTIADWIATPDRRLFQQEELKSGLYTAEIGPAGLAPQSIFFEVREGQANTVVLPTFSTLSSSGSNTSFFDTDSQDILTVMPYAMDFSGLNLPRTDLQSLGFAGRDADESSSVAMEQPERQKPENPREIELRTITRRVSIGLSQERRGRETFDLYKGEPDMDLIAGRLEIVVPCEHPDTRWISRRVRLSMAIEKVRIERCLLPLYQGGTRITIAAPPFSPDDLELTILPADPKLRALVRALDAGTSDEAAAVRDAILPLSGPDRLLNPWEDPWAAMLAGLLAIRFPATFPPLEATWTEKLTKRASWAFDAYVIQARQVLSSISYDATAIPEQIYLSAEELSRPRIGNKQEVEAVARAVSILAKAQTSGSPYFRYTNQLFGEMAAAISDFLKGNRTITASADQNKFERLHSRWCADLALQRGAGPTFTWLARDQAALKERHILVPHRNPSGRLRSSDTTILFEGEVKAGQISITASSPPNRSQGEAAPQRSNAPQSLETRGATEAPMPAMARSPGPEADPNKGRFGGRAEAGGFILQAFFESAKFRHWVNIDLTVEAETSRMVGLSDVAYFVLHPSFSSSTIKVAFRGRRARLRLQAWGGFTVGIWLPKQMVELELDLSKLATAPEIIRGN